MDKKKRQRFKEGGIVKINLSDNRIVFGILLPHKKLGIYDFVIGNNEERPSVEEITKKAIFLYVCIYRDGVTKGEFEIIGYKELTNEDLSKIPPQFMQDLINIDDCHVFWMDGSEKLATPEECVGLERSAVWEAKGLVQRIEDHFAGRKNPDEEDLKVILSKNDIRYLPSADLKWDFEKQEFFALSP